MVADAKFGKAQREEGGFGGFDLLEHRGDDGGAVGDAGAGAGHGGLVPNGEVEGFGELADLVLGDAEFGEG